MDNKKFGPGESSWPGKLGGEAVDDDDVEGHGLGMGLPALDDPDIDGEDGAVRRLPVDEAEDDIEGHGLRVRGTL